MKKKGKKTAFNILRNQIVAMRVVPLTPIVEIRRIAWFVPVVCVQFCDSKNELIEHKIFISSSNSGELDNRATLLRRDFCNSYPTVVPF